MIKLFKPTDKDYSSNGDKIIIPKKAIIHKEDNGSFYLDLETDLSYINDFTFNSILTCNTPQGDQAFRIRDINPTNRKISIKAKHVYYDADNYLIADSYVVDKNCNDALDHLNNATDNPSPFTTLSNINVIKSYRCVRSSLSEAIKVILGRWGGHLVRDNFSIKIMDTIGEDNDVVVRYAKNLKEISVEYDWSNVVTKLMPVGQDGLLLPEQYVESTIQYEIPYSKALSFQQDIDDSQYRDESGTLDEEAYREALIEDLRNQAQNYVEQYSVPTVNYTLKAHLKNISDVGDVIHVKDERIGVDVLTNVIAFDYDAILDQYIEIEFGNFTRQLNELIPSLESASSKQIEEATNVVKITLGDEINEATAKINSVLGGSYVVLDEGNRILIVDRLPKEEARYVISLNSAGIGFSQSGIQGPFNSAWTIDNVLNMGQINVINLTADLIKGGTLKLGSKENQSGILEVYDEQNSLIAELNKNGLKMYGIDGSYILMNTTVGFSGYDRKGTRIYWVDGEQFHQKRSVVEDEITLCDKIRYIPIQRNETVLGNNVFDSTKTLIGNIYDGKFIDDVSSNERCYYIDCQPNTTYYFRKSLTTTHFQAGATKFPSSDMNLGGYSAYNLTPFINGDDSNEFSLETGSDSQTIILFLGTESGDVSTSVEVYDSVTTLLNDGVGIVATDGGVY